MPNKVFFQNCQGAPKLLSSLRCNSTSNKVNGLLETFDSFQLSVLKITTESLQCEKYYDEARVPISKTGSGSLKIDLSGTAYLGSRSELSRQLTSIAWENPTKKNDFINTVDNFGDTKMLQLTQHQI